MDRVRARVRKVGIEDLITMVDDSILLQGVNESGNDTITQSDFLLG